MLQSHSLRVRPWMVDVASGVESAPGEKDRAKLVTFVKEAKRDLHRALDS